VLDAREAAARLAQQQQVVSAAQARLTQARNDYERTQNIWKTTPAAISKADVDAAVSALRAAEAEIRRARRAVEEARTASSYAEIVAPIDGTVIDRYADPGDTATPGKPLLRLYNPRLLRLEANVRETLAACEHYAGLGVRAVAIVSPFYYKIDAEGVYAYFSEIGRNTPIDVTLYNIPMFASPIDVPTIRRLADEHERIVGIKDSSGELPMMMEMIEAIRPSRPEFTFLTGWDPALMPMLLIGADGGTNATSGIAPALMRQLYETTTASDIDVARELQFKVRRLFSALFGAGDFPEGFRMGLSLRGIETGPARMPRSARQRQLDGDARAELAALFEREGLLSR